MFTDGTAASVDLVAGTNALTSDPHGRRTHITLLMASAMVNPLKGHSGIAPAANLVIVHACNDTTRARTAT